MYFGHTYYPSVCQLFEIFILLYRNFNENLELTTHFPDVNLENLVAHLKEIISEFYKGHPEKL